MLSLRAQTSQWVMVWLRRRSERSANRPSVAPRSRHSLAAVIAAPVEAVIAALTSQGKLQGVIVALLPLAVGVFLGSYRPDLVEPMFESAYGYLLVAAVVLLQGAGFLTIRRVVSVDV